MPSRYHLDYLWKTKEDANILDEYKLAIVRKKFRLLILFSLEASEAGHNLIGINYSGNETLTFFKLNKLKMIDRIEHYY